MFNIQPGTGVYVRPNKEIALSLGTTQIIVKDGESILHFWKKEKEKHFVKEE